MQQIFKVLPIGGMFVGYISIQIPDELHTRLKILATEKKTHLKNIVVEALKEFVEREGGGKGEKHIRT